MELVKNIFFNTDKIVEGSKVKISYVGTLFQNGSEDVYLHYGFGMNWDNVGEVKMEKTELGFQAEVDILEGGETLNLCYKNGNGEWDNNGGANFIFPIEKQEVEAEEIVSGTESYEEPVTPEVENIEVAEATAEPAGTPDIGETALTITTETGIRKGLRKTYIWSKKIKLAVYKIIKFVPKIISGNYKRKVNEQ